MAQVDKARTLAEQTGPVFPQGVPLLNALQSKGARLKVGLVLAGIAVVGLGVLGYSMAGHGKQAHAAGQQTDHGTDYVAGFEKSCIPSVTAKFVARGIASAQAKQQATGFCQCVATSMSDKLTPAMVAEAQQNGQLPPDLALDIAKSVKSCRKL